MSGHDASSLLTAVLVLVALPAFGQQRYTLEEDTWQQEASLDPASPEGQIQEIRRKIADQKPRTARKLATKWIENYPNHPMLAEAYLRRGDALVSRRKYFKALFDYEYVITVFPESKQFSIALEREYEIARLFAGGVKRRWLGIFRLSAAEEAEELFIRIQERSPGSEVAEKASLALGHFYFKRSEMTSAVEAYELFLDNYPTSQYRERATLRLIQANLASFKGPDFDATGLLEAAQRLKIFETEYPVAAERLGASALVVRVEESLALKVFHRARWYERVSQPVSAIYVYQRVIKDHPKTVAAEATMKRLVVLAAPLMPPARHEPVE